MTNKESETTIKNKKDVMEHLTKYGKHTRKEIREDLDIPDRLLKYALQVLLDENKVDTEINVLKPSSPYWLVA